MTLKGLVSPTEPLSDESGCWRNSARIELTDRPIARWDPEAHDREVDPGSYTAVQAASATGLRATVNVTLKTLNAGGGPTLRVCRTVV